MIDLTPLEVRQKKGDFRRAVRGYDPELVDDFLDLVADRLEDLVRENMAFAGRVERLEASVAEYRERERALTEALVSAQELREEVRRQAQKEAELLRREAEADAADARAALMTAREKEEEELRLLRARRLQLIQSFRTFLERELHELSITQQALEAETIGASAGKPRAAARDARSAAGSSASKPKRAVPDLPVDDPEPADPADDAAPAKTDWLSTIVEEER